MSYQLVEVSSGRVMNEYPTFLEALNAANALLTQGSWLGKIDIQPAPVQSV